MKSLLEAYYRPDDGKMKSFLGFCEVNSAKLKKRGAKILLGEYFLSNPLDFCTLGDSFLYFILLHTEILKALNSGKTALNVEVDHVASGVMFLGFFLRNRKMAEQANALGGPPNDPYLYCVKCFPGFYDQHMVAKNDLVCKFFSSDRKVMKYALMCFCYSQTHTGRLTDFRRAFEGYVGRPVLAEENVVLKEFAVKYKNFMEFVFPTCTAQLDIIYKTVRIAVSELGFLPFKNLQGETFQWSFFKYKKHTRSAFDPMSLRAKPYNSYKLDQVVTQLDKNKEVTLVKDMRTFSRKSLSYFIHCIDASMMHRFILEMYTLHKVKISHLHDCVLIHPNQVANFYDLVFEIYSKPELHEMIDNLFFEHIKNVISGDSRAKIEKLQAQFHKNAQVFTHEMEEVVPENVYRYEK